MSASAHKGKTTKAEQDHTINNFQTVLSCDDTHDSSTGPSNLSEEVRLKEQNKNTNKAASALGDLLNRDY